MRLLAKYNRISLVSTVAVMIITGVIYYFTISYILTRQVDDDLVVEENEIFDYVSVNHKLPQVFKSEALIITFLKADSRGITRHITDVEYADKDGERQSGRQLITAVKNNGVIYRVNIIASKVEAEDLIRLIFIITSGIILLIIVVLAIINRLVIRNLWKPFYDILKQITLFNLTDKSHIVILPTEITEFNDMNQEISAMSARVSRDYEELKRFVENASHELMTPIAVINSKLDTLIQTAGLTDKQGELIGDVYNTVTKLTRLNKAMLLLTKIENNLVNNSEQVAVKVAVDAAIADFQELFAAKSLAVEVCLADVDLFMSKTLLDILLNNLLTNAIRHNVNGGHIKITLDIEGLTVSNTGVLQPLNQAEIFQRFYKAAGSEGSGLGLTLAKQICENYRMALLYSFNNNLHTFRVKFN